MSDSIGHLVALRQVGFDTIEPSAPGAMRAFRRLGYKLGEALADLIDNSIDAKARHVLVRFVYSSQEVVRVVVADDGDGMSEAMLKRAMQFGAETDHSATDLGKYGMGMKTASFSQCRALSVISRQSGGVVARQWTERDITRGWACARLDTAPAATLLDADWGDVSMKRHGTIVVWDELDRLEPRDNSIDRYLENRLRNIGLHLGLVFHRLLEKEQIGIKLDTRALGQGESNFTLSVQPINPFRYGEPGNRHYPQDFVIEMAGLGSVQMRAHIWPAGSKGTEYSLGGKAAARQGLYFYRNDRLIQAGGWNGLRQQDDEPHLSLARAEVDLPSRLDAEFAVSTQKFRVDVPDAFAAAVRSARAGHLTFADYIRDAQTAYRKKPETREVAVPGPGFPGKLQRLGHHLLLGPNGDTSPVAVRVKWGRLPSSEYFSLDRQHATIILNNSLKARVSEAGQESLKALVFLLLGERLLRKRSAKQDDCETIWNQFLTSVD